MKVSLFKTLKGYKMKYLPKDIFSGLIIAAISIPISMGYALVAGLPAVYGLYGSVFPVLLFAMFSTNPQYVFGVDAAPAAVVGTFVAGAGIAAGSKEAMQIVPIVTLFAAGWLLLFSVLKFGKVVNYISTPVMGGFISGIGITIILMQIPKLYGGASGNGEIIELVKHIIETFSDFNLLSFAMGIATLVIIQVCNKLIPKFPMAIVMMGLGALSTAIFHVDQKGVILLSEVSKGLPKFVLPSFAGVDISECIGISITVAIVIMAETLLSENNFAMKNGYKINDNQEIFTYSVCNFAGALTGCCPINGSVSRTAMNEQFGGKTQVTSLVAGVTMILVLLFCTDFIGYLPVPVLTAIVISALMNVVEVHLAKRLFKVKKSEFLIFMAALLGVVCLGTIYGVIIGMMLSFVAVIIRSVKPATAFLGVIPGREGFFSLARNKNAYEIKGVVIYRFSGDLFFANIKTFQDEIENAVKDDTKVIIVDASGISKIDITAADRIEIICKNYQSQGIKFYLTEHIGKVNDELRSFGIGQLIEDGMVRRTITTALKDAGYTKPYQVDTDEEIDYSKIVDKEDENSLQEFVWAFGDDAEAQMEKHAKRILKGFENVQSEEEQIKVIKDAEKWGNLGSIDEDELIERLELHISEIAKALNSDEIEIEQALEERRHRIAQRLRIENPEAYEKLKKHREEFAEKLQKENPQAAKKLESVHTKRTEKLKKRIEKIEEKERAKIEKQNLKAKEKDMVTK